MKSDRPLRDSKGKLAPEVERIAKGVEQRFREGRRVLSFTEYLALFEQDPTRKSRDAIALTYLVSVAYVMGSLLLYGLAHSPFLRGQYEFLGYTFDAKDAIYPLVAGNPIFQVIDLLQARRMLTPQLIFTAVRDFTIFHLIIIAHDKAIAQACRFIRNSRRYQPRPKTSSFRLNS